MTKTALAMEIGPEACWLLTIVAMQEDACRYRRPVIFYQKPLCDLCGFKDERTLIRVRNQCMGAGWLVFAPSAPGTRRPGSYHVAIPAHAEELEDDMTAESDDDVSTLIVAPNVGRDGGRDVGRDVGRDGGRDVGRDGGRDVGRDGGSSVLCLRPVPEREKSEISLEISTQMEDIMAIDQATAAKVAAAPREPSWLDWRQAHPRIWVGRTGEDGDTDAWKSLWRYAGDEVMDHMYVNLIKLLESKKTIGYTQACLWIKENTEAST
jgi:hypothetical protein